MLNIRPNKKIPVFPVTRPTLIFFADPNLFLQVGELSAIFGHFRFRSSIVARNFPLPTSNRSSAISVYRYTTKGALLLEEGSVVYNNNGRGHRFCESHNKYPHFFWHKMFEFFSSSSICAAHMTEISYRATKRDDNARLWPVRRKQGD